MNDDRNNQDEHHETKRPAGNDPTSYNAEWNLKRYVPGRNLIYLL